MRLASIRTGLFLAAAAVVLPGCTKQQMQGQGSSYLIVDSLIAVPGTVGESSSDQDETNVLDSDVAIWTSPTSASVVSDMGRVTFRLGMKDPGSATTPSEPTSANFITVNRYSVRFVRSDNRNTQGVDVPYGFDGAATGTVTDAGGAIAFVLVRAQSKLEAPLMALRQLGGAGVISTIAEVTFYGNDQAGRSASVKALIGVNFADFADR
jgi:hypothetical protein